MSGAVDIFGEFGFRGKAGEDGKDGIDTILLFFEVQTLRWLRENMQCSFVFDSKKDFELSGDKIIEIKTRALNGENAKSEGVSTRIDFIKRKNIFCVDFTDDSSFVVKNVDLGYEEESTCLAVVTFKLSSIPEREELIFGDANLLRGLTIDEKFVHIYGVEGGALKKMYNTGEWNTIAITWKCYGDWKGGFNINDSKGDFVTSRLDEEPPEQMVWGRKFHGEITALDVYTNYDRPLPDKLCDIVYKDHYLHRSNSVCHGGVGNSDGKNF